MQFIIEQPTFDIETGIAKFTYKLGDHNFCETLHFPNGYSLATSDRAEFQNLLNLCACILGVSYFKLLAPLTISHPHFPLSAQQKTLILDIYENGLGEFYARNNLHRFGKLKIVGETSSFPILPPLPKRAGRSLVLIGGGKDSLVSVQLMDKAKQNFTPFAVNPKGPIIACIKAMDRPPLYVQRVLDKTMIEFSTKDGFYNGHMPSTAINSMIAALSAHLFGYTQIILSNERSASEGNIDFDGRQVNHQHSKSYEFEQLFADTLFETTHGALNYFSLLRPMSELKIAKIFADEIRYDQNFSSCNNNFKQTRTSKNPDIIWCTTCPKCLFVFLVFTPFMSPQRLNNIFGDNPLSHGKNIDTYRQLVGLGEQKPWECVGETLEAAAALFHLSTHPHWRDDIVVKQLSAEIVTFYGEKKMIAAWDDLMKDSTIHQIPELLHSSPNNLHQQQ